MFKEKSSEEGEYSQLSPAIEEFNISIWVPNLEMS